MTNPPSEASSNATYDTETGSDVHSLDVLFEALADRRRRYVLYCLREHETPMTLAELARRVAVLEGEGPGPDVSTEVTDRVHLSLYHNHVPKLADANVVEYTRERNAVDLSAKSDRVERLLERATTGE